jgi:hypothetical protein
MNILRTVVLSAGLKMTQFDLIHTGLKLEQTIAGLEGRDEILYSGPWLEVIRRDGWYDFARYKTSNGGVYILAFRQNPDKPILGRFEVCPAHLDTKPVLTTVTGGVNENIRPLDVAVQEMYEEAGYRVTKNQFMDLGKVYLAKGADFVGHLYAIDVTDLPRTEAPGDGTKGEEGAYCDWVSVSDALSCKDPVMSCLLLRASVSNMGIEIR